MGRLWPLPNVVSVARASHPLGLINAGDPEGAADDTFAVGQVYAAETAFALRWAALYNAAIAEACKPAATVASVLDTARRFATYRAEGGSLYAGYDTVRPEVERAVEIAARHTDPAAMRDEFAEHYSGGGYLNYGMSQANEIVSKGLAVFALTQGDARGAIIAAVNFGRDTDCLAAVAGGLAGALSGVESVPPEWIAQVNDATRRDPYTNNRRIIEDTADRLLAAFGSRLDRQMEYVRQMAKGDRAPLRAGTPPSSPEGS
jgi:hypothetical protein